MILCFLLHALQALKLLRKGVKNRKRHPTQERFCHAGCFGGTPPCASVREEKDECHHPTGHCRKGRAPAAKAAQAHTRHALLPAGRRASDQQNVPNPQPNPSASQRRSIAKPHYAPMAHMECRTFPLDHLPHVCRTIPVPSLLSLLQVRLQIQPPRLSHLKLRPHHLSVAQAKA